MDRPEFIEQYTVLVKQAVVRAEKARHEGLLALEDDLDYKKTEERDILEYGLRFVIDCVDPEIIEKILGNIVAQEKDEYTRLYKTIQKEAVLLIQQGSNPRILYCVLNSFADISLKEDTAYIDLNARGDDSESVDPND
ncbi:MAG: hypothetical protein FWG35_05885 [Spirochaetaceae bacterium]|nr:hypothetical protein [Spirochaetaceae bacterium]